MSSLPYCGPDEVAGGPARGITPVRGPARTRCLLACLLLTLAACMEQPLEPGDEELVPRIGQLRSYGLELPPDFEQHETITRTRWFDGSISIDYEFDPPAGLMLPYLSSTAERHRSRSDACMTLTAGSVGLYIGGDPDMLVERNDLFEYGDESSFALLVQDEKPFGNCFAMCEGKTSMMTILGGFAFDDGAAWGRLLQPSLAALAAAR
jgi:hypothetical protein